MVNIIIIVRKTIITIHWIRARGLCKSVNRSTSLPSVILGVPNHELALLTWMSITIVTIHSSFTLCALLFIYIMVWLRLLGMKFTLCPKFIREGSCRHHWLCCRWRHKWLVLRKRMRWCTSFHSCCVLRSNVIYTAILGSIASIVVSGLRSITASITKRGYWLLCGRCLGQMRCTIAIWTCRSADVLRQTLIHLRCHHAHVMNITWTVMQLTNHNFLCLTLPTLFVTDTP